MRRTSPGSLVLLAALSFSCSVDAVDQITAVQPSQVWVDDDWTGCSPGQVVDGHVCGTDAFDSIQNAIDAVGPGGTVSVASGTYREIIILVKDGLMVSGAGAATTTIDGGGNGSVVTAKTLTSGSTIAGFTITNGTGTWIGGYTYGGGVYVENATLTLSDSVLIGNHASDGAGGFEARDSVVHLKRNRISQNVGWWGGGVTLVRTEGVLDGNVVEQNSCGYGGSVWLAESPSVTLVNNQITRNGCYAPAIGIGQGTTATIVNNTIADNSGDGIATNVYFTGGGAGNATIYNCIVWGNQQTLVNLAATYSDTDGADIGEGNVHGYPDFEDPINGNYRIVLGSPAIDAGRSEGAPASDREGNLRPVDGNGDGIATVDIGAFEVVGPFNDVPPVFWAVSYIESLAESGITSGCGNNNYCPLAPATRAQMAVFLERGMHGSDFRPPAAKGNVFLDVGAQDFAASYIEQLYLDGITAGCGGNKYCPDATVSRAQMAVFLLRAKHGPGYSPPPATGMFLDVPLDFWAVHWIEQLAREKITTGCGGGNYCPNAPVTRDQMAVFLVRAFEL